MPHDTIWWIIFVISLAVIKSISKQKIMHSTHVGATKLQSRASLEVLTGNKFSLGQHLVPDNRVLDSNGPLKLLHTCLASFVLYALYFALEKVCRAGRMQKI